MGNHRQAIKAKCGPAWPNPYKGETPGPGDGRWMPFAVCDDMPHCYQGAPANPLGGGQVDHENLGNSPPAAIFSLANFLQGPKSYLGLHYIS